MEEKEKQSLINHILQQNIGEEKDPMDPFEIALFEEKIRAYLIKEVTQ